MSRTALKFLRDMWRHLVAMSLVLALMSLALVALERATKDSESTSLGEGPASQRADVVNRKAMDLDWRKY